MDEQIIFNFNLQNKKGFREILWGKGIFFSITSMGLIFILIIGFTVMPWKTEPEEIMFKSFNLVFIILAIFQYYKAIIRVSFNENNFYIKVWKKERAYPLKDISQIKTTYFVSWNIVLIRIRGKYKNKFYILWAPSFDKERYDLFLNLKAYVEALILLPLRGDTPKV